MYFSMKLSIFEIPREIQLYLEAVQQLRLWSLVTLIEYLLMEMGVASWQFWESFHVRYKILFSHGWKHVRLLQPMWGEIKIHKRSKLFNVFVSVRLHLSGARKISHWGSKFAASAVELNYRDNFEVLELHANASKSVYFPTIFLRRKRLCLCLCSFIAQLTKIGNHVKYQ